MPLTASIQGRTIMISDYSHMNTEGHVRRISKTEYVDLKTGEIKTYQNHAESRKDNKQSLSRTFSEIRALINTNITRPDRVLWVTLTYKENMTDTKRLKRDYNAFWKRFMRHAESIGHEKVEYITVVEPQARGAWHCHCLFIFGKRRPFIDNEKMRELWGHGFTKTQRLKNKDNVAGYLMAYLSDMKENEIESGEQRGVKSNNGADDSKTVKGARLGLYPPGMKIYRCSKGIRKPKKWIIDEERAERIKQSGEKTGEATATVIDQTTGVERKVKKEWYLMPWEDMKTGYARYLTPRERLDDPLSASTIHSKAMRNIEP